MKQLNYGEMSTIKGGKISARCGMAVAGYLVFGVGGVIACAGGPVSMIAWAHVGMYAGALTMGLECS